MSATTEKATRRELRRAVGEQAIAVVDEHTQLLDAIVPQLAASEARADYLERELEAAKKRANQLEDRILMLENEATERWLSINQTTKRLADTHYRFETRRLWERLKWAFFGC